MVLPIAERGYARPELLAETDWLSERLDDPRVRLIDARSADDYAKGHVPGAVSLPGMALYGADNSVLVPTPEEFARIAGSVGIGPDTTVVVYDIAGPAAARLAWALLYYGHQDVKLLDGGFAKWQREDRPLTDEVSNYPSQTFIPRANDSLYCSIDYAKSNIGKSGVVFWDVRSDEEYEGASARGNPPDRVGHLPGAIHLDWRELMDTESGTLRPASEIATLLVDKGITPEAEVVTY